MGWEPLAVLAGRGVLGIPLADRSALPRPPSWQVMSRHHHATLPLQTILQQSLPHTRALTRSQYITTQAEPHAASARCPVYAANGLLCCVSGYMTTHLHASQLTTGLRAATFEGSAQT